MEKQFPCPCCGYLTRTVQESGTFEICPVCNWEDDNAQFNDPDFAGGANELSLNQAKENFAKIGVSDPRFMDAVRPPEEQEKP